MFGNRLEEIDRGLFGTTSSSEEPFSDDSQTRNEPFTGTSGLGQEFQMVLIQHFNICAPAESIFEENEQQVRKSAKISVLKDQDRELFIPGGGGGGGDTAQGHQTSLLNQLENNTELLT